MREPGKGSRVLSFSRKTGANDRRIVILKRACRGQPEGEFAADDLGALTQL